MSKYQELNRLMIDAMKARKPEVSILRVVMGELQRSQKEPDDNSCERTIRKMIANNEETYKLNSQNSLLVENKVLRSLLPIELDTVEISHLLLTVIPRIREAKSEGMAIGIAMKILKATGKSVDSALVASIVKSLRL